MKILHFPENPSGIYLVAGVMLLASVLTIIDLGLTFGGIPPRSIAAMLSVGLAIGALFGVGLAIGLLYRIYAVWIIAALLACIFTLVHAFQLIFLMMAVSSAGEYLLSAITHALPLGLYSFVVFYLNSNEIRDLFGLVPLNEEK